MAVMYSSMYVSSRDLPSNTPVRSTGVIHLASRIVQNTTLAPVLLRVYLFSLLICPIFKRLPEHLPYREDDRHSPSTIQGYVESLRRRSRLFAADVESKRADFDPEAELTWTKVPQPDFTAGGGLNKLVNHVCLRSVCGEVLMFSPTRASLRRRTPNGFQSTRRSMKKQTCTRSVEKLQSTFLSHAD